MAEKLDLEEVDDAKRVEVEKVEAEMIDVDQYSNSTSLNGFIFMKVIVVCLVDMLSADSFSYRRANSSTTSSSNSNR